MCGTKIGREDKQNTETYSMGYKNSYKANICISQKGEVVISYNLHPGP